MYCDNLTRKARENKLDKVIGRSNEIGRVIQILSRRTKNNPCLVGEPGVGKTAIAEGLAIRLVKFHSSLKTKKFTYLILLRWLLELNSGGSLRAELKG